MAMRASLFRALLFLGLWAAPIAAQNTDTFLQNGLASYTFQYDGSSGEVWLSTAELTSGSPDQVVRFVRRPIWQLELRGDPDLVGSPGFENDETLTFSAENLQAMTFNGPLHFNQPQAKILIWEWTGTMPSANSAPAPQVLVRSWWRLRDSRDYAETFVEVKITNPGSSPFLKIWNVVHPRLQVANLDPLAANALPGHVPTDVLATGRYGGLLHRDPINYVDAHGNRFVFQTPYNTATGNIGLSTTDPGIYSVPVVTYYDTARQTGLYLANDDDRGYVKSIYLTPLPAGDPEAIDPGGDLRYEVMQFPEGDIWQATDYLSPYYVLVGVHHGDWVDAAQKYKRFRREPGDGRFGWLEGLGPAGDPSNLMVPAEMKTNPLHARLENLAGTPYCVGNLKPGALGAASANDTMAAHLEYLQGRYGTFSRLMFARSLVAFDEVRIQNGGFVNSPLSPVSDVNQLALDAGAAGHPVLLDSLTEKYWLTDLKSGACSKPTYVACPSYPSLPTYSYCCAINAPDNGMVRDLAYRNSRIASRTGFIAAAPCPAGRSTLTGYPGSAQGNPCLPPAAAPAMPFMDWFTGMVSTATDFYDARGGLRFNAPSISVGMCFARDHDHPPGFGTWYLDAWLQMVRDIRTNTNRPYLPVTIETSNAAITMEVAVQNPWSTDAAIDYQNVGMATQLSNPDPSRWDDYFDAPIAKIPMMQMVADEVRYATQYGLKTLALPYTRSGYGADSIPGYPTTYFQDFPSVTGAITCWMMGKRVLGHQSSILISNAEFNLDLALATGLRPADKRAQDGILDFYNGLAAFLKASGPLGTNMEFLTGSMERNVDLVVSPLVAAGETFVIPSEVISPSAGTSPFPDLQNLFDLFESSPSNPPNWPFSSPAAPHPGDIAWDRYRPYDAGIFQTRSHQAGGFVRPIAPEERETWLPHGVYRHWDRSNRLALLVANPWGVTHAVKLAGPGSGPLKPVNPFDFDFLNPVSNPDSRVYAYTFEFDPAGYEGFGPGASYSVVETRYDLFGNVIQAIDHGSSSGKVTFSADLGEFEFAAFTITAP